MRAAIYDRYGSPDVLRIEEVPTPSPGAGQVLIRVAATSINLSDWECLRGSPMYARIGGSVRALLRVLTVGWVAGRLTRRRIGVLAVREGPTHFGPLVALCIAGDIGIHIDRTFALDELPLALAHVGEGHALGKVVVTPI